MNTTNNILLIRAPVQGIADCRELRDFILESLPHGVLVLTEDASLEVMELPRIYDTEVQPVPEPQKNNLSEAEEKREILRRLQAFREKNGAGCMSQVTRRMGRSPISAEVLRGVLTGDSVLEIGDWRRIGRTLDRLEASENA